MTKKVYVGNLSFDVDNVVLESLLSPYGTVENVNVITDRNTGQSKGYGFVEMSTEAEAQAAVAALNGSEYNGRSIKVAQANPPRTRRSRRGSGRGGRGGYGGRPAGSGGGGYGRDRY